MAQKACLICMLEFIQYYFHAHSCSQKAHKCSQMLTHFIDAPQPEPYSTIVL
jgi:hypothetical protein